jgi:hypothetical protein
LAVKGVRERNMKIIGISGKKGAGKDTVCDFLQEAVSDRHGCMPVKHHIIDKLQMMYISLFTDGFEYYLAETQEFKAAIASNGKTNRQNMKDIGMFMREIDPDVWVNYFKKEAKSWTYEWRIEVELCGKQIVIVPDVRFPNEIKAIHAGYDEDGGKVIRLTRCPHPEDTHESETALDFTEALIKADYPMEFVKESERDIYFDAIIDNANMTEDEANKAVLELVTEREWI